MVDASSIWKQRCYVAGLLAVFAMIALSSVREKSGTFDELFHISGGYSYWQENDYRIHNTNGNLVQRWIALPLLAMNLSKPSTESLMWYRPVYFGIVYGDNFFFQIGNDARAMLWYGRVMIVLVGVALGWVVYAWSKQLFGRRAGLLSLTLYAFSPTIIAHSQLATSDISAALGFTLSIWCMWRLLHRLTPRTLAASCVVVGLTAVVKFSAPLLGVIGLLLAIVRLMRNRAWTVVWGERRWRVVGRAQSLVLMLGLGVAHVVAAAAVIWACYGFRYSGFAEFVLGRDDFGDSWEIVMSMRGKTAASIIEFCREYQLLPEAYLYGLGHTLKFSEERPAFLLGECSKTGWWYYHPYCYLAKTSLATHLLSMMGVAALAWRWKKRLPRGLCVAMASSYRLTPLLALLVVYWSVAIRSHLNLGVRHVLPVYPAMFILAGAAAYWIRPVGRYFKTKSGIRKEKVDTTRNRRRTMTWTICALLTFHILDCLLTYPNYLAYFNWAVGGPSQGYKQLVDSNLDWGQELPGLAKWLKEFRAKSGSDVPFYLEYLGTSSPPYYGIQGLPLRDFLQERVTPEDLYPLRAGTYCLSATVIAAPNETFQRWSQFHEKGLQELVEQVRKKPTDSAGMERWEKYRKTCGYLQFARLLAYLREREPDERINYALHIYHLSDSEIDAAMHGPLKELGQ